MNARSLSGINDVTSNGNVALTMNARSMSGINDTFGGGGDVFLAGNPNTFTGTNTFNTNRPTSDLDTTPGTDDFITKSDGQSLFTNNTGDALLAGGTEASPQTFTEFNKFDKLTKFEGVRPQLVATDTTTNATDYEFITKQDGDELYGSLSGSARLAGGDEDDPQIFTGENLFEADIVFEGGIEQKDTGSANLLSQVATGTTLNIFSQTGISSTINSITQVGANSTFNTDGTIQANGNITSLANIRIGNPSTDFPLDIATTNTGATNVARTFFNSVNTNVNRTTNWSNDTVSINCVGDIHAGTYIAASDVRIKKDIMDLPSTLPLIEQIKPKTYKFINPKRRHRMTYGFIAQELEEVLPCVIKKSRNKIPNVMKIADISGGVFTLQEATDLIEGDIIAIFDEDDTELKVKITELISDKQFKVETETELKDKYFIYGKFVDDFQSVEHNCLMPIAIKGIQELNAKNKSLEDRLAILEDKINEL